MMTSCPREIHLTHLLMTYKSNNFYSFMSSGADYCSFTHLSSKLKSIGTPDSAFRTSLTIEALTASSPVFCGMDMYDG